MFKLKIKLLWILYRLKRTFRILLAYGRDALRFIKSSSTLEMQLTRRQLEALMVAQYHAIEKGFNLPDPKPAFGVTHLRSLMHWMGLYRKFGHPLDSDIFQQSLGVLNSYLVYHESQTDYLGSLETQAREMLLDLRLPESTGRIEYTREKFLKSLDPEAYRILLHSRHSVRMFTGESVPVERVLDALDLAKNAPSACNRQPWRVIRVRNPERMQKLCELQQGNRGFGHLAGEMVIICSDLSAFHGAHERNQAFIDGGIFSFSLLMALHAKGLGACSLNWSAKPEADREMRKSFKIPYNEVVIMCIAIGLLPEKFSVAQSTKWEVNSFVREET